MASWHKKSYSTAFWMLWSNEWNGAFYDAIDITWYWHWHKWHYMTKTSCCTSLQSSQPNECSGAIDSAIHMTWNSTNCIIWPKKTHVAPFLNHLDLMNGIVLLTMPLASYDSETSASSATLLKKSCQIFWVSWPNKCIGAIDNATSIIWYQHWHHRTKNVMLHLVGVDFSLCLLM